MHLGPIARAGGDVLVRAPPGRHGRPARSTSSRTMAGPPGASRRLRRCKSCRSGLPAASARTGHRPGCPSRSGALPVRPDSSSITASELNAPIALLTWNGGSWQKTTLPVRCQHPVAISRRAPCHQGQLARVAVMDVRRRYPGQQRMGAERGEKGGDMLRWLHRHLCWQERVGLRLVQSEGQDAASRLHPRAGGRSSGPQARGPRPVRPPAPDPPPAARL